MSQLLINRWKFVPHQEAGRKTKFHYNRPVIGQPRMTACDTHTVLGAKEAEKGDLKIRDFA